MFPNYFRLAKIASYHSSHRKPMGAVIVNRRPISFGYNIQKTHPEYSNGKEVFSVHCEIKAIISCQCDIIGSDIYIFRQNKLGELAMAKPCKHCLRIIIESGISKIFYTTGYHPYYEVIRL